MKKIRELYEEVWDREAAKGRDIRKLQENEQLDCLLHPDTRGERRGPVNTCMEGASVKGADTAAVLSVLAEQNRKVYALIAPAFMGQFGADISPGRVRAAFKAVGFWGMVEVAVFADILTLKEALEFDRHVVKQTDFQLTSCCCPVWISMIRDIYGDLVPHVPGAVSPMIAAGRAVKKLYPGAVTVFIGPCLAKKKEAKEPDIADAVDYVLTFQEMKEIFEVTGTSLWEFEEDEREHSSTLGRIYARTGGVSEAVRRTVEQLHPGREIMVRPMQADGVAACKKMIAQIAGGEVTANFYEGMACAGGCVGGPKALIDADAGRENVNRYGSEAPYQTPLENPYVLKLIEKLGFDTVEDFLTRSDLLTRDFSGASDQT